MPDNKCAKRLKSYCKVYRQLGQEDINRRRKMRRHIRNNPNCVVSKRRYEETFGRADSLGITAKGKKLIKRAEAKAKEAARAA